MFDSQGRRRRFSAFRSAAEEVDMADERKIAAATCLKYVVQQRTASTSAIPRSDQRNVSAMTIKNTDLVSRVLANERILRTIIRHIAE